MCDRTHNWLHAFITRYIESVDASEWPAPLRAQGDRAVDSACQYGLGLIRMLAEYEVREGIPDGHCAELAATLMAACGEARRALERTTPTDALPSHAKPLWRAGHKWTSPTARRLDAVPRSGSSHAARALTPAAASARPGTLASADTPAAP